MNFPDPADYVEAETASCVEDRVRAQWMDDK
jgi:hypothetical protein